MGSDGVDSETEVRAAGMASWHQVGTPGMARLVVFSIYHCWSGFGEPTNNTVSLEATRYEGVAGVARRRDTSSDG